MKKVNRKCTLTPSFCGNEKKDAKKHIEIKKSGKRNGVCGCGCECVCVCVSERERDIVLSTSSLIWPSYTLRATIFEKVF